MNPTKLLSQFAIAAALTTAATASNAALTTYISSAAFVDATTAAETDTFNDVALDFLASAVTRSTGSYGYTLSSPRGLFGAGEPPDVWLGANFSADPLVLSAFTGGVRAVGAAIFATDIFGDFLPEQDFTVTATDSLGASSTSTITKATLTSFVGFVSSGYITSMTIEIGAAESYAAINNLILASSATPPVPEPATYGMLLAGLGALAFLRRRRDA